MTEARVRPDQALILLALSGNPIRSTGPHGEPPTSATEVELTYAERKRLRALGGPQLVVQGEHERHASMTVDDEAGALHEDLLDPARLMERALLRLRIDAPVRRVGEELVGRLLAGAGDLVAPGRGGSRGAVRRGPLSWGGVSGLRFTQ